MQIRPNGKLWQALKEKGLTQRTFAEFVGEHVVRVNQVVNGYLNLKDSEQEKYAHALDMTVEELFD